MAHATALVLDDATTPDTHACFGGGCPCSCAKLAAVGWVIRCTACGRGMTAEERAALLEPYLVEFPELDITVQELVAETDPDAAYDAERDAALLDEAERRAA